ncbi:MAG TPA: hypothetical protein VJ901_17615 [Thermoanaerobaculia bacterium]|nr:hypothetical protein [Thermoanaerobaculia bacterium]
MEFWFLVPLICGPAGMAMVTIIIVAAVRGKERRAQMQAGVQTKLIDKFGSAPELLAFLKTDEGRQFLGEIESGPKRSARDRIIRGIGKSLVITMVGLGFLIIGFLPATYNEFCIVTGFLLLFLGAGLFLSALLSLKLSRNWGLMDQESSELHV